MNFLRLSQSNQELLTKALNDLFPCELTVVDSKKQSALKYPNGAYIELDMWVPKYNLCFEFQDLYHYASTWYSQRPIDQVQLADMHKKTAVHKAGITLIIVPYWWDGTIESLVDTIYFQRPDIGLRFKLPSVPISLNPLFVHFQLEVPEIGELMLAKFPDYDTHITLLPCNWWIGEKYDGIRCCWIPAKRQLYTRSGKELHLLPLFVNSLPNIHLDAELWFGRGTFSQVQQLLQLGANPTALTPTSTTTSTSMSPWHLLRMNAFDVPALTIQSLPLEHRYKLLLTYTTPQMPLVVVVSRLACSTHQQYLSTTADLHQLGTGCFGHVHGLTQGVLHVQEMLHHILAHGGEGLILQEPASVYKCGRSPSLLKLKGSQGDKEAVVIAKAMKSVVLKMPNGDIFSVPRQNVLLLLESIAVGDVVTFSYERYSRKMFFVNPTIYQQRSDLSWEEVVAKSMTQQDDLKAVPRRTGLSHTTKIVNKMKKNSQRRWTDQSMRLFFEDVAKKYKMEPTRPDTWKRISATTIVLEGGKTILEYFKGYSSAIQNLFPEFALDSEKFGDITKQRRLFENYARCHGFDPTLPENWYQQSKEQILAFEGTESILRYYKYNFSKALINTFPDIGLDKTKFIGDVHRHRVFFENYAKSKGFDFHIPEIWYAQSSQQIMSTKGALGLLHNFNITNVLCSVFPDIGLDAKSFRMRRMQMKQRSVFERFAKRQDFDPHNAANWYKQSREQLLSIRGIHTVLKHYRNNVAEALVSVFPKIGLEKSKLLRRGRQMQS